MTAENRPPAPDSLACAEALRQAAARLNARYPGPDLSCFSQLLENAITALEISRDPENGPARQAEERSIASNLLFLAADQAQDIHEQLRAAQPEAYTGGEWLQLKREIRPLLESLQRPGEYPPETFTVLLEPAALLPAVKAGFPPELRQHIRFCGEVTWRQYATLTGVAGGWQLKDRLAVEREGADGFPIQVLACDVVTEHGGWHSLQMQLIRHFLAQEGIACPQTEAECQRLSKTTEQMSFPALRFLLQLARDYSPQPFELTRQNFAQALADFKPPVNLEEFAHRKAIDAIMAA